MSARCAETQSFVALLFKTIENKEYLNVKKDGVKEEKKDESKVPATNAGPPQSTDVTEKENDNNKPDDKENDDYISSTDEKQNGVQIQSSVVSEGTVAKPIVGVENKVGGTDAKEDRKKDSVSILFYFNFSFVSMIV